MPTRTFNVTDATLIDFIVDPAGEYTFYVAGAPDTSPLSDVLVSTGVGSWEFNPNLVSNGTDVDLDTCSVVAGFFGDIAAEQTFSINFDRVSNPIPDNAKIKKLTYRKPKSINIQYSATTIPDTLNPNTMTYIMGGDPNPPYEPDFFSDFPAEESVSPFVNPRVINQTVQGTDADEVLFDLTGGPTFITKAELIALWSDVFENNINVIFFNCASGFDGIANPVQSLIAGSIQSGLGWVVTVEYEEAFEWNLSQSAVPIDEGNISIITSPEGSANALDLEQITDIDIVFPDPNNPGMFITIPVTVFAAGDENNLTYTIPSFGIYEPPYFNIVVASTQFSGSLDLGALTTIIFLSASGLYTLEFGKTNDTLYLEDDLPNTIDVKIPDPFIKTGFVDG